MSWKIKYAIIYDENGEPIDAKIRESTSKSILLVISVIKLKKYKEVK